MSKQRNRRVSCEPLENRLMFVTYQVTGTSGDDAISISIDEANNKIISAVNGHSDSASDLINNTIEINALGGNDTISITETGTNEVDVDAGAGDDTINIANGGNNLDSIQGDLYANGQEDDDQVFLFDQNSSSAANLFRKESNRYWRNGSTTITIGAEDVTISSGSHNMNFETEITAGHLNIVAKPGFTNIFTAIGQPDWSCLYSPSATTLGSGHFSDNQLDVDFSNISKVVSDSYDRTEFDTAGGGDVFTLGTAGTGVSAISGTTGGVAFSPLNVTNAGVLQIDLGASSGGSTDSLTATGGLNGADSLELQLSGGTKTFTANSGTWPVSVPEDANLDVVANNSTINFTNTVAAHRFEINNGGTIAIDASLPQITLQQLAVVNGTGTLNVASGATALVTAGGVFSIGAGRTLNKTGAGTLSIGPSGSHGANATLDNKAGNLSIEFDSGSTTSRTLNLRNTAGTTTLALTQHLKSVHAEAGVIAMTQFGSRMIVTNSATTGSEGVINLNDNDMIVDYTTAAEAIAVRQLLHQGRGNGSWAGLGINSHNAAVNALHNTTLASIEATEFKSIFGATGKFDGETPDNTAVLIKYTYYGDSNFNGKVDGGDYTRTDFGFANHLSGWINGDFNDDGKVNGSDYTLLDFTFGTQSSVLSRPGSGGGRDGFSLPR